MTGVCPVLSVNAQTFTNSELNGSVNFNSEPTGWNNVPDTDPNCLAFTAIEATVDLLDATGPNQVGGVAGIPYSGTTFCSGLQATDNGSYYWHEGIQQNVAGFTIGQVYTINFAQAVVKQQNCIDESGSWRVYVDGNLIATTAVSTSNLAFDDVNLIWDCRTVSFTATSNSHLIQFLPWDDDANQLNDPMDNTGALRMGIDLIEFIPSVDPTITSNPGTMCAGDPNINLTAVDGGGTWTGNGITDAVNGTFDPSTAGVGSHTITYTLTAGCSSVSDDIIIDVTTGGDASWTAPTGLCTSSGIVDLQAFVSGSAGGSWSGTGMSGSNFDPSVGTQDITYTVGNPPCDDQLTLTITVNAVNDASWNNPGTICESNGILDLNTLITGTPGGVWSGTGVSGSNFDPSGLSGPINITYDVGAPPCDASETQSITVTSDADPSWNSISMCAYDGPIDLNTLVSGDPGGSWSGLGVNGSNFDPAGLNGPVYITYTVGVPPCQGVLEQPINVIDLSITIANTSPSCFGDADGAAIANVSGGTSYTYSWNSNPVQTGQTANNLSAGDYQVIVTDVSGCVVVGNTTITEPSAISLVAHTTPSCGQEGWMAVEPSGGTPNYTYNWAPGGYVDSLVTNISSGTYNCTVTDAAGCSENIDIDVVVYDVPAINVSDDTTIIYGESVELEATGGNQYTWTPSDFLSCNDCANPIANPVDTTIYCVSVTDTNGCSNTACVRVSVKLECGDVFVPNAFSPNGNGNNDLLCVYGNCVAQMNFAIYDRWGEKVFESQDTNICWDGTFRGKEMNTGVYVYLLEGVLVTGEEISLKGNISLIR